MAVSLARESALSADGFSFESPLCPKKAGRTYLRPATGTGMPSKKRFQRAPFGARFSGVLRSRNFPFRCGQKPKLREISFGFWLLDNVVSSVTGGV